MYISKPFCSFDELLTEPICIFSRYLIPVVLFQGIGSKLMEKMGYVVGTGLGREGEGRVDPVTAYVYPQGVSLGIYGVPDAKAVS